MVYSIKPKLFVVAFALAGLCSLVVNGCASNTSESRRLGSDGSQRPSPQSRRAQGPPIVIANYQTASATDVLLAQDIVRKHLHALSSSNFHQALNLLTPEFRERMGDEARFASDITNYFGEFTQVKRVRWNSFLKEQHFQLIMVDLIIESKSGSMTKVSYTLQMEKGHYLIARLQPIRIGQRSGNQGPSTSPQDQIEQRIFSGVLFSPTPRHRVLDSFAL